LRSSLDRGEPLAAQLNRNTNGLLLRQYFPKKSDLAPHSQAHLNIGSRDASTNGRGKRWTSIRQPSDLAIVLRRPIGTAG
jgi:IS30 family transposase